MRRAAALILSLFTALVLSQNSPAQDEGKMKESYNRFIQLNAQGGERGAAFYDALYVCYTDAFALVNSAPFNSAPRSQALEVLKTILPVLPNGAVFYEHQGSKDKAALFAAAYADGAATSGMGPQFINSSRFKQMAYYAGARYHSNKQYEKAIRYINYFLYSGPLDEKMSTMRPNTDLCLAEALIKTGKYDTAMSVFKDAAANYPNNLHLLSAAIDVCSNMKDYVNLQFFLSKARTLDPGNKKLLLLQGQLHENNHEYARALEVYAQLYRTNPNDATVVRHLGLNQYNMGVLNYNSYLLEKDVPKKEQEKELSLRYFRESITNLRTYLDYDPTSLMFTQALAVAYSCTGNKKGLDETNRKLASLGADRIADNYIPTLISEKNTDNSSALASSGAQGKNSIAEIPPYSSFAKDYITTVVTQWQQKDPYENVSEYQQRVNEATRKEMITKTNKKAEQEFIATYAPTLSHKDLTLKKYDADNGSFLIDSPFGSIVLSVPRENNEARIFETNWEGVELRDVNYGISSDRLCVRSATFATPFGKDYKYDKATAGDYAEVELDLNFGAIDYSMLASNKQKEDSKQNISKRVITAGQSDVDINIPALGRENANKFAVIIANEDYTSVAKVPMAGQDGNVFADYCVKALGIPRDNVRTHINATYGMMVRAIRDIKEIANVFHGDIDVVFYYAGHGIPDEATKSAFLLPIDADGKDTESCYSLERLYSDLESMHARQTTVFLDACFSGSQRGDGMLASARGVALKVEKGEPRGNVVVFSAASSDETAYPYKDKGHGLFTYFVLKKLQENSGTTLGELADYVTTQVSQKSIVINKKSQTPVITPSASSTSWRNWKL